MKIVTGNEKRVTRVRMWPIHSNIELVAKPYKFIGAFSEGFCIQAMVAGCCGFSHAKNMNGKSKEHGQNLTEDDLEWKP